MKFIFSENPFISFQGEGKNQGQLSLFLRFSGCSIHCKFCDSKFSWKDKIEVEEENLFKLIDKVNNVVFTGGEPLQHKNVIMYIISKFKWKSWEIETNGTIPLSKEEQEFFNRNCVHFNISPKIEYYDYINKFSLMNQLKNLSSYNIKFLLEKDMDLVDILMYKALFTIPRRFIYLQPKAVSSRKIIKLVKKYKEFFIKNKFNLSARLHIFLYGKKKGV